MADVRHALYLNELHPGKLPGPELSSIELAVEYAIHDSLTFVHPMLNDSALIQPPPVYMSDFDSALVQPPPLYMSDFVVADGALFFLLGERLNERLEFTLILYRLDLCDWTLQLLDGKTDAHMLLGVLDGAPILSNAFDEVWLASQPKVRTTTPSISVALQMRDAVWLDPHENVRGVVGADLAMVDGRLDVRRSIGWLRARELAGIRAAALAARQLPPGCLALSVNVQPQCAPSLVTASEGMLSLVRVFDVDGDPASVPYEEGFAMIDGRTGTVVWIDSKDRLCLLRGAWRPSDESARADALA